MTGYAYRSHACPMCGLPTTRRSKCSLCAGVRVQPGALVHPSTRYELDPAAQMIASMGGATLEMVGEAMGISRERVRQIEAVALRRLKARCRLAGITEADVAAALSRAA